ncbi:MAG: LapA family protein [Gemmatimonadota bacterium]|jgi:uncharacterized integral membrane protein|nr:LapA family protein [Gemmatimonadota bacterium]MDP6528990.1 LapA family protein [Gemmatimonadota bacterium]MDP6801844.1 LapA family protein [Gemmatimonadota bacterium]MDP7031570.1 LapA family protein [Gemmatimonadota bacterium]
MMRFLSGIRAGLLLVLLVVWFGFTALNNSAEQQVDLDLLFTSVQAAPLAWALFCVFVIGMVVGYAVSVLRIMELGAALRSLKRSRGRVQDELTSLRNLPLEDPVDDSSEGGTPS